MIRSNWASVCNLDYIFYVTIVIVEVTTNETRYDNDIAYYNSGIICKITKHTI